MPLFFASWLLTDRANESCVKKTHPAHDFHYLWTNKGVRLSQAYAGPLQNGLTISNSRYFAHRPRAFRQGRWPNETRKCVQATS
jgi:hypothetical protein